MRRSLLIGVAALLITGCVDRASRVLGPNAPIALTRITPNAPSIVYYSGLVDPARLVIDNPATLASVWARAFADESEPPPIPRVDFRRERVIVAALGGRATGGYGIELASADVEGGQVVVDVVSTSPGQGCAVTQALTQPVDMAKIALSAMGIRFVEHATVRNCSTP